MTLLTSAKLMLNGASVVKFSRGFDYGYIKVIRKICVDLRQENLRRGKKDGKKKNLSLMFYSHAKVSNFYNFLLMLICSVIKESFRVILVFLVSMQTIPAINQDNWEYAVLRYISKLIQEIKQKHRFLKSFLNNIPDP